MKFERGLDSRGSFSEQIATERANWALNLTLYLSPPVPSEVCFSVREMACTKM